MATSESAVLKTLGVSSLVDMVNAAKGGTPSSVLGPFHIEGAPEIKNGDIKVPTAP